MNIWLSALLLISAATAPDKGGEDIIFKAMSSELDRSMQKLQLSGHQKPYFVSYNVKESDSRRISGSFGAVTDKDDDHSRTLSVDVRVGDYKLDSSSASTSAGGFDISRLFSRGRSHSLTTDDNYNAFRRELWLQTDGAYKKAIEGLQSNESYLKQNTVEDRPDSLSKETPVVHIEPIAAMVLDMDKWSDNIRKLSGVFRDYPNVRSSSTTLSASAENRWFLNNEGFKYRIGETGFCVTMQAQEQSPDGMKVADSEIFPAYHEAELPSQDDLMKAEKTLGDRLDKLAAAPLVEDYRGPILFEGQAGAEFFHQMLEPKLLASPSSPLAMSGGDSHEKLGERLLPKFISVVDDPKAKDYNGQVLLGTYDVDDEGVEGQKITLIDKGILKTLCIGRTPTRKIKQSNGHAHLGVGATSNLFIISDNKLPVDALKAKLIELGKEDGLSEVYIARKIADSPGDLDANTMQALMRSFMPGGGGAVLFPPVLLYRVSTADGHEELTRGGMFSNVSLRTLRDIEATGDDAKVYPSAGVQQLTSIIAPSVLVKEIEIQKPERTNSKGPVLKNPYFEHSDKPKS